MQKALLKNSSSWLVTVACSFLVSAVVAKSGPSAVIVILTTIVTVLLLQVTFLRRDLSTLKEKMISEEKN